ncbi:MAG: SHOCT domain-containing protein [Christensenellales bacterium]|jgi:hypothetical protein
MTNDQFDREKNYGAAMALSRTMLSKGLISEKDYRKIDTIYKAKYRPVIGALPSENP